MGEVVEVVMWLGGGLCSSPSHGSPVADGECGCNNHINPTDEPAKRADGLPGSTLGLKWDPSHCGPLGVCVDSAASSAPRRGPTSAHAHLARLAREGQWGQDSQDSQGIHTSWRSHLPILPL
ncbi:unnamed protein product [Lota lota]